MITDVLRSRARSAEATALDTIAAAARAVASGGNGNVDAVEAALATIGKEPADFEAAVALARRRAEWLALVDKLPSAKSNLGKVESALQIEGEKFLAAQTTYAEKATVLRFEHEEANAAIRDGTTARDRLLDPKNVPGGIAAEYAEAVAQARAAESARNNAEGQLKEIAGKLSSAADWVKRISGEAPEDIDPATWKAPEGEPEWHRDGHSGDLESKLKKWRQIGRERDAIRDALATATKDFATWKKKRDGMASGVLKS